MAGSTQVRRSARLLVRVAAACLLLLVAAGLRAGQVRGGGSQAGTPVDQARKALNRGDVAALERLLGTATDPTSAALRAQAYIDRGRYADAERLLAPMATASPSSEAALRLGTLHLYLGRRQEAQRILERLIQVAPRNTGADLRRIAEAEYALGRVQDANETFKAANRVTPDDVAVNVAWGDMFAERFESVAAGQSYDIAIKGEPDNVRALVGKARLTSDQDPPAAKKQIQEILAVYPTFVPAHLLSAELALDEGRRDDARIAIGKALETNPRSLEAMSLDAALAMLQDRPQEFEAKAAAVLAINPRYGEVYRLAADQASHNYRYIEAADFARRAVATDPESPRAYASLGMQLLRTGDEAQARAALERAFRDTRVGADVVTKNLLDMLDALEKFQTVREGDLILRFSPEEAAVMKEYAVPFAKAAVESLTKQWGFTPKGPLIIEMFPKHDDFAVRTMGLPGMVGALGVCFGTVVALDSPRARPPGDFSWQETLLHELTHVMTIQLSNNRVPRWLTEGVSVWSERQGRGDWGRETHVPFARALDQGKILKLKDLNEGFQDPQMIVLAYYQASLVVDHLVATYGQPKLRDFVQAFSRGLDLDGAFRAAYGVGVDDVQKGFDAALERDFGTLRKALRRVEVPATASVDDLRKLAAANPDSFLVHMRLADALRKSKDNTGALAALDRAAALVPQATGDASPHVGIATIALELKDTPRALRALDAFLAVDPNNVEWARRRAELVEPLGDARRTEAAFQRVVDADPFDTRAQTMVGRLSLARRDGATAARAFRAALAGQPADRAAAHLDLAKAYLATGQKAEAKQEALAALEIAPTYEAAQDVLLQVVGG